MSKWQTNIENEGEGRYVLGYLVDFTNGYLEHIGGRPANPEAFVLVSAALPTYKAVCENYQKKLPEHKLFLPEAGGILNIDRAAKTISTKAIPGEYLAAHPKDLERVLGADFGGYTLNGRALP